MLIFFFFFFAADPGGGGGGGGEKKKILAAPLLTPASVKRFYVSHSQDFFCRIKKNKKIKNHITHDVG